MESNPYLINPVAFVGLKENSKQEALKKAIPNVEKINSPESINRIISIVCAYYKQKRSDVISGKRKREASNARHVAMYMIGRFTTLSYRLIGEQFNRDHSTVIFSINKVRDIADVDKVFKKDIEEIEKLIV